MAQLHEIEAFVAVAERGSFAAGARALGVSGPYASKLVARLEERIGQRLLQRTTRRLALTDAGERYLADAQRALGILAASAEGLRDASGPLQGPIRVSAPTGLGLHFFGQVRHLAVAAHPGFEKTRNFRLVLEKRHRGGAVVHHPAESAVVEIDQRDGVAIDQQIAQSHVGMDQPVTAGAATIVGQAAPQLGVEAIESWTVMRINARPGTPVTPERIPVQDSRRQPALALKSCRPPPGDGMLVQSGGIVP